MPLRGKPIKRLAAVATIGALLLLVAAVPDLRARQEGACVAGLGRAVLAGDAALQGELDILSWNIQKASNEGWARDLAELSGGVQLAFIQEASLQAGIPQAIPTPLVSAFAAGYTTTDRSTGVMTLSASDPNLHCNFTAREPLLGTPKATSITEYNLQGREERLLAINLHAVNFTLGLENFQRQFDDLAAVLRAHRGPVIFAGDLNTWSGSRQALVDDFMGEHDLAAVSFEPDLRTTAFGRALDHIYVRGMETVTAEVIPVSSSDHNPLRVRLALK